MGDDNNDDNDHDDQALQPLIWAGSVPTTVPTFYLYLLVFGAPVWSPFDREKGFSSFLRLVELRNPGGTCIIRSHLG